MDIDLPRLRIAKRRGASTVLADASRMPISSASIDLVVLRAVSHHVDDRTFATMIAECRRVLKHDGRLLFLDAVWVPSRLPGLVLWRLDQGSHPRTREQMLEAVLSHFDLEHQVTFSVFHTYLLAMARPKLDAQPRPQQRS
jgi:ubiquinone/menaquinone biosynthesis C-methylase UbiE